MMAGSVVDAGAGAGAFGGAADVAGALVDTVGLADEDETAGSASAGLAADGLDAIRGAAVGCIVRSVDGATGDDTTASSGMGVCTSSGISTSNGRRGRFFLRGGLITGGEARQRTQVTKWCWAASTASSGTASGSMSRSTSTEIAKAHAGGKCWSIAISILH